MTKIIPTQKARQGRTGKKVLLVLVAALALTAAVWYAVEIYGEAIDPVSADQPVATE